jgi:hypothetical protein
MLAHLEAFYAKHISHLKIQALCLHVLASMESSHMLTHTECICACCLHTLAHSMWRHAYAYISMYKKAEFV